METIKKYGLKPNTKMRSKKRFKIALNSKGKYEKTKELLYEDNATIPDQSLKIRDILERFTKGLPVNAQVKRGVYPDQVSHESPDIDALGRMDRTEKLDFTRSARLKMKEKKVEEKPVEPVKKADEPPA